MRIMKATGCLTNGHGMSDATICRWVNDMTVCSTVSSAVEIFAGVTLTSSERHIVLQQSQNKRDHGDFQKCISWLRLRNPVHVQSTSLMSIYCGCVANESVNCDSAYDCEQVAMESMKGTKFSDIHLRRKDSHFSQAISRSGDLKDEVLNLNCNQLVHRITCILKKEDELQKFLIFELTTQPPALFDNCSI